MLQNTQISDGGGGLIHGKISNDQFLISNEGRKDSFEQIISVENLLAAWQEFVRGKRAKRDVQEFSLHLMDNILALREDLQNKTYKHGRYNHFKISDPKPRDIHKSSVRDRLVHHAIYRILYPFYDKRFIADSYSCRLEKGTHKALDRFRAFAYKVSKNNTRTAWVLKCDIRKFFASIDHTTLISLLRHSVVNEDTLWLLERVIESFRTNPTSFVIASTRSNPGLGQGMDCHGVPRNDSGEGTLRLKSTKNGLPLGNLTSQLLVNIYMNEFDQWVKHSLKQQYYIRYADDFVFLSESRAQLEQLIPQIQSFLAERLRLELHPKKLFLKTLASGVDFLGWVHFPNHRVLRTASKRRMLKRLSEKRFLGRVESYRGLLSHGNTWKLRRVVR